MKFDEFVKKYLGTKTDYDKVCGVQCVDLVKLYLNKVFGIKPGAWGNAKNYWTDFEKHPELVKNFKKIKNTPNFIPEKGDIVIWDGDISSKNNYGHIAIATGEGNTSYFYSYDQNWGGKPMAMIKHTYKSVYGVLRPQETSKYGNGYIKSNTSVFCDNLLKNKIGSVSKNERVKKIATLNDNVVIIYKTSSGYKCGFIKKNYFISD